MAKNNSQAWLAGNALRDRNPFRWLILAAAVLCASSCTTFNPLDQSGETINRNATDYANNATLLNVVRASLSEPLTFIAITSLDGTDQAGASVGLPGITLGPKLPTTPRNYFTFGPNSVTRSNQNTFHISVVDDPASFTALLAPLNPAMVGFFIRQGYPRELLFFLFTDRLREVELDSDGNISRVIKEWVNDPTPGRNGEFPDFIGQMATLLKDGFTAEIDVTNVPTGRAVPLSRLCMDATIDIPIFAAKQDAAPGALSPPRVDTCESANWIQTQGGGSSSATSAGASTTGGTAASGPLITVGPDNSLWVALGSQNKVVRITHGVNGALTVSPPIGLPSAPKSPKSGPYVAYLFQYITRDERGVTTTRTFQLYMRSTYGVYNYVGALLHYHTDVDNLLALDESGYGGMIHILKTPDRKQATDRGCFAEITYRQDRYCVPNSSDRTKRIFALLHELQQLNTAPSNSPTTLTTVSTPAP
jgi:hypothetical protein